MLNYFAQYMAYDQATNRNSVNFKTKSLFEETRLVLNRSGDYTSSLSADSCT